MARDAGGDNVIRRLYSRSLMARDAGGDALYAVSIAGP